MPKGYPKLRFFFEVPVTLRHRSQIKKFIESVFRLEKTPLEKLNYIFTTDRRLLELNKKYLDHDYLTDILTFDLSEEKSINAEIYISIDRVKENAFTEKTSFSKELLRVMIHGALHLCGFNDKTRKEQTLIHSLEDAHLQRFKRWVPREIRLSR